MCTSKSPSHLQNKGIQLINLESCCSDFSSTDSLPDTIQEMNLQYHNTLFKQRMELKCGIGVILESSQSRYIVQWGDEKKIA